MSTVKFVEYRSGKAKTTGRPYSFVALSDGLMTVNVGVSDTIDPTDFDQFERGQEVEVDFDFQFRFGRLEPILRSIRS